MIRVHIFNIWKIGFFLPIQALASCVQATLGIYADMPAMWLKGGKWMATIVLKAELTKIHQYTNQVFPWKLQAFNRL